MIIGLNVASNKKQRLISLRLTEDQFQYLEKMARRIQSQSGMKATRTSIVMKLMEYGLPALQRDFPPGDGESEKDDGADSIQPAPNLASED